MRDAEHAEEITEQQGCVLFLFVDDDVGGPSISQGDESGQRRRHPHVRELVIASDRVRIPFRGNTLSLGLADTDGMRLQATTLDPFAEIRPSRHTHLVTCIAGSKRKWCHGVKVPERGERRDENTHRETLLRNGARQITNMASRGTRRQTKTTEASKRAGDRSGSVDQPSWDRPQTGGRPIVRAFCTPHSL